MKKTILVALLIQSAFTACAQVQWTNVAYVIITGQYLEKVGNISTAWNAGAISQQYSNADGWVEFRFPVYKYAVMGLAPANTSPNINAIHYGIYAHINGFLYIYEKGYKRPEVGKYCAIERKYLPTDVLRVERIGTTVYYKKNGVVFYTSTIPSTGPIYVDCSFNLAKAAIVLKDFMYGLVWTGAVNENWEEPGNWSLHRVPTMGDQVIINGCTTCPVVTRGVSVGALQLNPGSKLDLSSYTVTVATVATLNESNLSSSKGKILSANFMEMKNNTFAGAIALEKTGGTANICYGGNKFSPELKIINESPHEWNLAAQSENLINDAD